MCLRSANICNLDERGELVAEGKTDVEAVHIVASLSEIDVDMTEVSVG